MSNFDSAEGQKKGSSPALLAILICVAWLLTGALFKLYKGSPADLPPTVLELSPLNAYDTFKGAIAVELCIAAIALIWPRIGWALLAALFVVFIALLTKLVAAGAESCGCLGGTIQLAPWQMMAIDGVLLALLLWSQPWKRLGKTSKPIFRMVLLAPIFVLSFWLPWTKFIEVILPPAPTTTGDGDESAEAPKPEGVFYMFDPPSWEGKMLFDDDFDLRRFATPEGSMDMIPAPAHVVLYRKSCDHCAEHIETMTVNPVDALPVVLIRIPEIDDANVVDVIETKPAGALEIELIPLERGYGVTTPTSFEVDEAFIINTVVEMVPE